MKTKIENLSLVAPLTAIVDKTGYATLAYLEVNRDDLKIDWHHASIKQFLDGYEFDEIVGIEGNALVREDLIICADGIIKGEEILCDDQISNFS